MYTGTQKCKSWLYLCASVLCFFLPPPLPLDQWLKQSFFFLSLNFELISNLQKNYKTSTLNFFVLNYLSMLPAICLATRANTSLCVFPTNHDILLQEVRYNHQNRDTDNEISPWSNRQNPFWFWWLSQQCPCKRTQPRIIPCFWFFIPLSFL